MENETYVVQEGDTLISIAQLFGVRVIDLIEANNLENVYNLIPGTTLTVPTDQPLGFMYYTVVQGDNLYQIARKYNINMEDLAAINGLEIGEYIFPGQRILVPKEGVYAYITKEGDTLRNISEALGVSPEDILIYNRRIYLLPEQLIAYSLRNEQNNSEM